jgi:hypothetical protein
MNTNEKYRTTSVSPVISPKSRRLDSNLAAWHEPPVKDALSTLLIPSAARNERPNTYTEILLMLSKK